MQENKNPGIPNELGSPGLNGGKPGSNIHAAI